MSALTASKASAGKRGVDLLHDPSLNEIQDRKSVV